MKQVLLLAAAAFSLARLGVAAPCAGGTLSGYVALGMGGCTIGGNTLHDFMILSGIGTATPIAPSAVAITPTGSNLNPGLIISTNQTATAPSLFEIIFTYQISGGMYIGSSALLGGSSEAGDGAVTGIENYCAGGLFGPDGVSGCPVTNGALVALDGTQQSDQGSFGQVSFLSVTSDLTIDGGLAGSATGGTFANNFTAVPEPFSTALAGLGLTLVAVLRLGSVRAKQESK